MTKRLASRIRYQCLGRALAFCLAFVLAVAASVSSRSQNQPGGQNPPSPISSEKETKSRDANLPRFGEITGRVTTDDGQPVPNARVSASALGGTNQSSRSANTDADGNFRLSDLPRGAYSLFAASPGFVSTSTFVPASERPVYRLGETATITLVKGGVITGAVADANGVPISSLTIRAIRVRDAEGRTVAPAPTARDRNTDDRGIYRIYGLVPGSYVVMAVGLNRSGQPSEHDGEAPTFHPSSTRDTASEVTVRSGEEVGNVDIRFRAEPGHVVSGTITGNFGAADAGTFASVELSYAGNGLPISTVSARLADGQRGFAIYGVADGEYEVSAQRFGEGEKETLVTLPRRVTVKGSDVTGVRLSLTPLGSIAGRMVLEPAPAGISAFACAGGRTNLPQETSLTVRRADPHPGAAGENELLQRWTSATTAPNDQSEFVLRNLMAARYRIETRLPNEGWYLRSIAMPGPARQPVDAGRGGIPLKSGEKARGVTISIAIGAAALRGKILAAAEGAKLPPHLRVHLIPTEPERADDMLRYAQANAQSDGSFALTHLAPGKYWLLARAIPDDEAAIRARPTAWDNNERAKLRHEAEAAKIEIELQPCERVSGYALRYASPVNK